MGEDNTLRSIKKLSRISEDKFPGNVNCATTHSVAFRSLISQYTQDQLTKAINAN